MKKNFFPLYLLIFCFSLSSLVIINGIGLASPVETTTSSFIHVATSGDDSGFCGSVNTPCRTIQRAVDFAGDGDIVLVAGGTYTDANTCAPSTATAVVCIWNKHLTIRGGYTTSDWSESYPDENVTIIDGQNSRRGVYAWGTTADKASLLFEGFTVQNGRHQGVSSSDDNISFAFGGGMLVDYAPVTIKHTVFKNNEAIGANNNSAHGGAGSGGGLAIRAVNNSVIEHVTFIGNEAKGGTGSERGGFAIGGGLYTYQTSLSGEYLTFQNNKTLAGSSAGSGLAGWQRADAQGAGAAFQIGSNISVHHLNIFDNQAIGGDAPNGDAGGAFGGGIFAEVASLILTDSNLYNNLSQGGNGRNAGPSASMGIGGGISTGTAHVVLDRVRVVNNLAKAGTGTVKPGSAGGGGVDLSGTATIRLSNMIIADNKVEVPPSGVGGGGGLFVNSANISMDHMTFARNQIGSSPMQGNGIVIINGSDATLSNSIIADHTQYSGAFAIHAQPGNTVNLDNNLFSGNTSDLGGGGSFFGTNTSFGGDPHFVSSGAPYYDYHITNDSVAIDKAPNSSMELDIDGQSRSDTGAADVGADEFVPFISIQVVPDDTIISLEWAFDTVLLPGLAPYPVIVTPSTGATAPAEGTSISTGLNTSIRLTGLSNYKSYNIVVQARNQAGDILSKSNSITVSPTDIHVYLPVVAN